MAGGPDTKAARAYQAAVARDERRQADTPEAAAERRQKRADAAAARSRRQMQAWASEQDDATLQRKAARGPTVINGFDYMHEAAQAELDRRRPKA